MFAYVGCYTTAEREAHGRGIGVYRIDRHGAAWTLIERVDDLANPSFLAVDAKSRFLYSVHGDGDALSAFRIDPASGRLTLVNRQILGGKNAVHLALDKEGRFIVTANYANGTISLVPIATDGSLMPVVQTLALPGEPGPHKTQQTGSRPHHCPFDPSGRFVLVPDKGLDRIFVFRVDAAAGRLVANEPAFVAARPGAAPRHIAFHPGLPYAFGNNELDTTVTLYAWDGGRGTLQPQQVVPSVPDTCTLYNTGAEIAVAPSGRFLYASNRGHDSIAIFAIDGPTGRLTPVGWEPTRGRKPRFFALDPAGEILYAANEAGDTIVAFRVDPESGRLSATGAVIETASPACIVFAGA